MVFWTSILSSWANKLNTHTKCLSSFKQFYSLTAPSMNFNCWGEKELKIFYHAQAFYHLNLTCPWQNKVEAGWRVAFFNYYPPRLQSEGIRVDDYIHMVNIKLVSLPLIPSNFTQAFLDGRRVIREGRTTWELLRCLLKENKESETLKTIGSVPV